MKQAIGFVVGTRVDPNEILSEGCLYANAETPEEALQNCQNGMLYKVTVTVEEVER